MTDAAFIDLVAAHRPYGMDCKCGRPINSDRDWAQHLIGALGLAEEGCPTFGGKSQARLVGPWREVTE